MKPWRTLEMANVIPISHDAIKKPIAVRTWRRLSSLALSFAVGDLTWTEEMEKAVNALHALQPNPCP